ncbi:hypothetical protein NP493_1310g00015 [Ridgeia piscesae]|uniref:Uncharacterized protein n=1 Tax=Ridgeia piscesae TaxID=27915 RepID=A0AAD9K9Q0_RIDPI|nr:hypothetical protein NP493_1310g00015 [Ridgeia piscesae]
MINTNDAAHVWSVGVSGNRPCLIIPSFLSPIEESSRQSFPVSRTMHACSYKVELRLFGLRSFNICAHWIKVTKPIKCVQFKYLNQCSNCKHQIYFVAGAFHFKSIKN